MCGSRHSPRRELLLARLHLHYPARLLAGMNLLLQSLPRLSRNLPRLLIHLRYHRLQILHCRCHLHPSHRPGKSCCQVVG